MTDDQLSEEDQRQRAEWITRMEDATRRRFPLDLTDATATDPDVVAWCDAYLQACEEHRMPPRTWSLMLLGLTGRGKTWQAYGAIRRIATAGIIRCNWLAASLPDLFAALRPRDGIDAEAEYEKYATTGLLLVDDLGAAKDSPWTETTLYRLVNHRSMHLLPTIWTTNLPPAGDAPSLQTELSERTYSRLCTSRLVTIKGGDRRKPPKATRP